MDYVFCVSWVSFIQLFMGVMLTCLIIENHDGGAKAYKLEVYSRLVAFSDFGLISMILDPRPIWICRSLYAVGIMTNMVPQAPPLFGRLKMDSRRRSRMRIVPCRIIRCPCTKQLSLQLIRSLRLLLKMTSQVCVTCAVDLSSSFFSGHATDLSYTHC